jgi:hypothetical protein
MTVSEPLAEIPGQGKLAKPVAGGMLLSARKQPQQARMQCVHMPNNEQVGSNEAVLRVEA